MISTMEPLRLLKNPAVFPHDDLSSSHSRIKPELIMVNHYINGLF